MCRYGQEILSVVESVWLARTRACCDGNDSPEGAAQHHDYVMAYDDGVRAADRRLRNQQSKLHLRYFKSNEGMRDQHPDKSVGRKGGTMREYLRTNGRQVQGLWPHSETRLPRCGSAHRRVLCESGMQGHRCKDGGEIQLLHPRGA